MDRARLLIADDDPVSREAWLGILNGAGHEVDTASTGDDVVGSSDPLAGPGE